MDLTTAAIDGLRHDPQQLRDAARDLLSRPPYTDHEPGPVTDVLVRIRSWVAGLLDALLGAVTGSTTVAWLIVAVATTAIVVLVLRWGRRVTADPSTVGRPTVEPTRPAAAWREEAEAHAAAHRWPDAVRAAYGAVVTGLVEDGLLDDAGGLTVGEIDRQVARSVPARAAAVARAGRVFEDVWYGHRTADRHHYEEVADAARGRTAVGA